jgi:tetratricopeptide (TPR) repeat protein
MKTTKILILLLAVAQISYAQTSKRVSANNYYKDGDFDLAKENIDACVVNPKTEKDARAWLYYGQIYYALAVSEKPEFKKLDPNAIGKSYDGYKKAILFNFKDPALQTLDIDNNYLDMIKFSKALMDQNTDYVDQAIIIDFINGNSALSVALVNKGLIKYQDEKDYNAALDLFEKSMFSAQMIGNADTQVVYFCALAASNAGKTDKAIEYYKTLSELGFGADDTEKARNFYFLAKQYASKGDTAKYIKSLEAGIQKYPNNSSPLMIELINHYLAKKQQKEALAYLDKGIELMPTNPELYYVKGTIYDSDSLLKNLTLAEENYKKAIEIDPKHFNSYYAIGVIYYNQAAAKNDEANAVDPDDVQKYKKIKTQADDIFKKALPYLEKAHEIDPKDMNTMQSLKIIYYRIGEIEKSDAMKAKIDGK